MGKQFRNLALQGLVEEKPTGKSSCSAFPEDISKDLDLILTLLVTNYKKKKERERQLGSSLKILIEF